MGSKTDYLENVVLDMYGTGKTSTVKPTVYVALFTAAPSDAAGGTEVTGGSYARKSTAGSDWNAASGGSVANAADIVFTTPTGSWGTVTHFATFDASTAGNMLYWGALGSSKTIGSGDPVKFAAGSLVLTED